MILLFSPNIISQTFVHTQRSRDPTKFASKLPQVTHIPAVWPGGPWFQPGVAFDLCNLPRGTTPSPRRAPGETRNLNRALGGIPGFHAAAHLPLALMWIPCNSFGLATQSQMACERLVGPSSRGRLGDQLAMLRHRGSGPKLTL